MKRTSVLILAAVLGLLSLPLLSQQQRPLTADQESRLRQRYPAQWEVQIPAGTKLAELKSRYETRVQLARVPTRDLEDESPYPVWFRAYLREQLRELPSAGRYQYPRVAQQILEWMLAHPNFEVPPPSSPQPAESERARIVTVGANINVTNLGERNSESFVAVDYSNPQNLVAASNNISGSGRQRQFASSNSGSTWSRTELPLAPGTSFQSDPAVAWTTDGTAWAATLGIGGGGGAPSSVLVQVFKSVDTGATWSFVATVSSGNNNDKELMWIDTHPTSPFKDNIYVAWDVPGGGMRFARSTNKGATWSGVVSLSSDQAIGAHLASGPSGELYVAWPDTSSRQIRVRKSTDGGATFAPAKVIATTNDSYEISVPSFCSRKVLIYVAVGVDRSNGPRKGSVYAVWNDRDGSQPDPGCAGISSDSNSNVYFSRSTDGGNSWSTPVIVHTNPSKTDQFNPWMDVDPDNGNIHVTSYDTRDDPGRKKTHIYYVMSKDGGNSWVNEVRVTTAQTDETAAGADSGNQYGDYNGLAVFKGAASPVWTDRRSGVPSGFEQIYTARVTETLIVKPPVGVSICAKYPWICNWAEIRPDLIELECVVRGCLILDPIPKNCLVKWSCPGCQPGSLCPPYYHILLDRLDPVWEVGIADAHGNPVDFEQFKTDGGIVLSFRPSKEHFIDGQIGDYFLVFRLSAEGKPGIKYRVKSAVKASDKPFRP